MDSSNAERAWEAYVGRAGFWTGSDRFAFKAGHASRDAEVAELTRLLAESRARFGDSEARRAELEAVIEKVRGELHHAEDNGHHLSADCQGVAPGEHAPAVRLSNVEAALSTDRPVVLEDRDREVEARALEDFAARAERMFAGTDGTDKERAWIGGVKAVALRLRQRAAAIRKGDTNA